MSNKDSALDGFETYDFAVKTPTVTITANGLLFNTSTVKLLGHAEYVNLLIHEGEKQIAIRPCERTSKYAKKFYGKEVAGSKDVRWNGKALKREIEEITGWKLPEDSYRIQGRYVRDENAILYDLKKAKKVV